MKVVEVIQEEIDAFETLEVLGNTKYNKWLGGNKYLDKFTIYHEQKIVGEDKYFIYAKIDNDNIVEFVTSIEINRDISNFKTNVLIDGDRIRSRIKDVCNKYQVEYIDERTK